MLKNDCNHEWQENRVGKFTCTKCGKWELPDKVYQSESLKHQLGFQKKMTILAFIVSVLAFIVSVAALLIAWFK